MLPDCCLTMNTKSMSNKPIQMNCKFYLNLAFEQSFKINYKTNEQTNKKKPVTLQATNQCDASM